VTDATATPITRIGGCSNLGVSGTWVGIGASFMVCAAKLGRVRSRHITARARRGKSARGNTMSPRCEFLNRGHFRFLRFAQKLTPPPSGPLAKEAAEGRRSGYPVGSIFGLLGLRAERPGKSTLNQHLCAGLVREDRRGGRFTRSGGLT